MALDTNIQPKGNMGSMVERALIAYLTYAFGNSAAQFNFYFSHDFRVRKAPLIDVLAHRSVEAVPHTRCEEFTVRVEMKWKGGNEQGQSNAETTWQQIDQWVGVVDAAMSVSDDGTVGRVPVITAADITSYAQASATIPANADLANFVCDYIEYAGAVRAQDAGDGTFFINEIRNFKLRVYQD